MHEDTDLSPICFDEHEKRQLSCEKSSCRRWINSPCNLNCAIIAAKEGPKTLQEVGDVFGITRMRVCQIEKSIMEKIRKAMNNH